jgi:hypothetical protein
MQLPRELRRVVFYSEGPAYWIHLNRLLERFLDVADVPVCYLSSDQDDPGLALAHPNLKTFIVDEGWIRDWLFANIDTDLMVLTTPDLHQYQLKRSKHKVHYVYVQHSLVSQHMAYRPGAFDHFDTIFCAGPHHVPEIRALEKQRGTRAKNIVEHGYQRLDEILAERVVNDQSSSSIGKVPHILIAPSWGANGIVEKLGNAPVETLLKAGFRVTLRPHPQTLKHSKKAVSSIVKHHLGNPLFHLDDDTSSIASLQASDVMISDWSGAALDYAFGLGKPVAFIDTPRKVNNLSYKELNIEPFESNIRSVIGEIIPQDDLAELGVAVNRLLGCSSREEIRTIARDHVFNIGRSSEVGANALLKILTDHKP